MPSTKALKKKNSLRRLADGEDLDNIGVKLLILLFFAGLIAFSFAIFGQKKPTVKKSPRPRSEILGEQAKTPVEDAINLGQQAQKTIESAAEEVQKMSGNVLSAATESAATFVVQNAGESIFTQIEKLPEKQQEELKKQICK